MLVQNGLLEVVKHLEETLVQTFVPGSDNNFLDMMSKAQITKE